MYPEGNSPGGGTLVRVSEEAVDVWLMPFKSQEFERGPELIHRRGDATLRLDYETESGLYEWMVVLFTESKRSDLRHGAIAARIRSTPTIACKKSTLVNGCGQLQTLLAKSSTSGSSSTKWDAMSCWQLVLLPSAKVVAKPGESPGGSGFCGDRFTAQASIRQCTQSRRSVLGPYGNHGPGWADEPPRLLMVRRLRCQGWMRRLTLA